MNNKIYMNDFSGEDKGSPELRKLNFQVISNPPLNEVLKNPNIVQLFQNKSSILIQYMTKHVHELFQIALSPILSVDSLNPLDALYILCTTNYNNPMLEIILDDSTFTRELSVIINTPDVDEEIVSRLATLTFVAFRTFPLKAINSCWFLSSFMPFVKNSNVCSLIIKLCDYDQFCERTKVISKWLKKYGLAEDVINELSKINYNRKISEEEKYADSEVIKLLSLYQIIIHSTKNPILADSFKTESMVSSLSQTFLVQPHFLTGKRYEAISSIANDSNVSLISPLVANAVSMLYTPHTGPTQSVVEAIRFITHISEISASVSEYLKETQLYSVLLRYAIQFPNATFLHIAFRDFVLMSFNNSVLCQIALDQYLQILMAEARMRSYGACALVASFYEILLFIQKRRKKNELLNDCLKKSKFKKDYLLFEKEYVKKFKKKINAEYGGKIENQLLSTIPHNPYID